MELIVNPWIFKLKFYFSNLKRATKNLNNFNIKKNYFENLKILFTFFISIIPFALHFYYTFRHMNYFIIPIYIVFSFLSIPLVLLIRIIKPILWFRFGRIRAAGLGQSSHVPEVYLSRKSAGKDEKNTIDLFFFEHPPAHNKQIHKMICRNLIISPLVQPFYYANLLFIGWKNHIIKAPPYYSERDVSHSFTIVRTQLKFLDEEKINASKFLNEFGIFEKKYVCVYFRDAGYRMNDSSAGYISDINEYIFIIKKLISLDYIVIRMGKNVKNKVEFSDPKFIDYGYFFQNDFMDIWLCAHCEFFINAQGGGLSSVPIIFRRPVLTFDYDVFTFWSTAQNSIVSFKKIIKNDRLLTLSEIIHKIGSYNIIKNTENFSNNYSYEYQSKEEIKIMIDEIVSRINGKWEKTLDEKKLQEKFWKNLKEWEGFSSWHGKNNLCDVSYTFLKKNGEWLLN